MFASREVDVQGGGLGRACQRSGGGPCRRHPVQSVGHLAGRTAAPIRRPQDWFARPCCQTILSQMRTRVCPVHACSYRHRLDTHLCARHHSIQQTRRLRIKCHMIGFRQIRSSIRSFMYARLASFHLTSSCRRASPPNCASFSSSPPPSPSPPRLPSSPAADPPPG